MIEQECIRNVLTKQMEELLEPKVNLPDKKNCCLLLAKDKQTNG